MMPWALFIFLALPSAPGSPSATTAVDAYEDGQMHTALNAAQAVLQNPNAQDSERATARLVEAFAYLRMGRAEAAQESLQHVADQGPDLGPYLAYLQSRVANAVQDCNAAVQAASRMPEASVFAVGAWGQAGECLLRRRDADGVRGAVTHMERSADNAAPNDQAQVDWLRGRADELTGSITQARDVYRSILVDFPFTPAARAARERLAVLKRRGVEVPPWQPDELLPRAETERESQRASDARRTYGNVVAKSRRLHRADLAELAELGLVELDIVDQKYTRALHRLAPVIAHTSAPAVRAQGWFLQADLLGRLGRVDQALEISQGAIIQLPHEGYTQVAALGAAQLAYNQGDNGQARKFIDWLTQQPALPSTLEIDYVRDDGARAEASSTHDLQDRAYWLLAWIELREHGAPQIVDSYLGKISTNSEYYEAALYWRARLALDAGNIEDATVFVRLLAHEAPTSYYALVASDALNQANPSCGVHPWLTASEDGGEEPPRPDVQAVDLKAGLVLYEAGMHGEARRLLRLTPVPSLSDADRVLAAYLYRRCGDLHRAAILTRQAALHGQDPAVVNLAYPRPYADLVQQASQEFNVPVELIYAIMREESAFNPFAVSPRQAFGLMQMIPPTARRLARQIAWHRAITPHKLFNPRTAIRLGTAYLAALLHDMDGDLPAAVAAYQAGETAVHRWRLSRGSLRRDEFIEDLPLASTRSYVKKVLASYGVYRLLNGMPPDEAVHLVQQPTAAARTRVATN